MVLIYINQHCFIQWLGAKLATSHEVMMINGHTPSLSHGDSDTCIPDSGHLHS